MAYEALPQTPSAVDALSSLYHRCFLDAWERTDLNRFLGLPGIETTLALSDGVPCGFSILSLEPDPADLIGIGVDPDHRRLGVGKALLERCLSQANFAGRAGITLEVAENNAAAVGLYLSLGFEESGRRPNYYKQRHKNSAKNAVEDALVLHHSGRSADAPQKRHPMSKGT